MCRYFVFASLVFLVLNANAQVYSDISVESVSWNGVDGNHAALGDETSPVSFEQTSAGVVQFTFSAQVDSPEPNGTYSDPGLSFVARIRYSQNEESEFFFIGVDGEVGFGPYWKAPVRILGLECRWVNSLPEFCLGDRLGR